VLAAASQSPAADTRIDGVVKAVDADNSSITITATIDGEDQDRTLDVLKKVKVTVDGQAAALKDARRGQKVTLTFNPDLEVVTKIDLSGAGVPDPELVVLKELPRPEAQQSGAWLSEDGLTLYWKGLPPGEQRVWIWSAQRKTKDDLFENVKRLVPGHDPTVTRDGLEMVFFDDKSLHVATRTSADAAFQRPQKIAELQGLGLLAAPCFGDDGLSLYAERLDVKDRKAEFVKFSRPSRRSKWGKPQDVKLPGFEGANLRFLSVTPDGSIAFCSVMRAGEDWTKPAVAKKLGRLQPATAQAA
jgi:hypothetical protein